MIQKCKQLENTPPDPISDLVYLLIYDEGEGADINIYE